MNTPTWFGTVVDADRERGCRTVSAAIVNTMEDKAAVAAEVAIEFFLKIKALRSIVRVKKNFIAIFRISFESLECGNEFSCEVVFPGESFDLIKFAVCAIMYHNIVCAAALQACIGIRRWTDFVWHTRLIYWPQYWAGRIRARARPELKEN